MLNNKKGISPVVATALIIVVAVVAVIGFQNWFGTYSTGVFVKAEKSSQSSTSTDSIETIVGNQLYIKSGSNSNLSIKKVTIDGNDCEISLNVSGVTNLTLGSCLTDSTTNAPEVVIITDDKVISKKVLLRNFDSDLSTPAVSCSTSGLNGFAGGDGSLGDPYQICNCNQLQNISNSLASNYILISNIDCNVAPYNTGSGFSPIGTFTGDFNGDYYTIDGLYIDLPATDDVGLFSISSGLLHNVKLSNVDITGSQRVGSLVGQNNGNVENTSILSGNINGTNSWVYDGVGGLVGNNNVIVRTSSAQSGVNVYGDQCVGGLIGQSNWDSYVYDSYSIANVYATHWYAGGLIGGIGHGSYHNLYSGGTITTTSERYGGIAGYYEQTWTYNHDNTTNSFSVTSMSLGSYSGIFAGDNNDGTDDFTGRNNYWYNDTVSGVPAVGGSGSLTNINEITTLSYFYNGGNEPMNSWDSNLWSFSGSALPKLAWE